MTTATAAPTPTPAPTAVAPADPRPSAAPSHRDPPHGARAAPSPHRLSLPLGLRLALATTTSLATGLALGLAKGSTDAGYRFRAENAHRLPDTRAGWFLYHKSKHYHMMLGGVAEGARHAGRLGAWTALFFVLEEGVDRARAAAARAGGRCWGGEWVRGSAHRRAGSGAIAGGDRWPREREEEEEEAEEEEEEEEVLLQRHRDCGSSMLAGLGTAGVFSAWNRFPVPTAARTAKMGAKAGLAFGLLQDLAAMLKGRRVGYVEWLKRHTVGAGPDGGAEDAPPNK